MILPSGVLSLREIEDDTLTETQSNVLKGKNSLAIFDTGNNRFIRQPLRRHSFKHHEWIEQKVAEMQKHKIVKPAASPWAFNVVIVKMER